MTMHALRTTLARVALLLMTIACHMPLWAQAPASFATRVLDNFADIAPWQPGASDGVLASIHPADGVNGAALRLDFDLAVTLGPRRRGHPAVRLACAEGEGICGGCCGPCQDQRHCQDR